MRIITLILLLLSIKGYSQTNGVKYVIYPGCENYVTQQELNSCMYINMKNFSSNYFKLYRNMINYFQYPNINDKALFVINKHGDFEYTNDKSKSVGFNHFMSDYFNVYNSTLKHHQLKILPAELSTGERVDLNYTISLDYSLHNPKIKKGEIITRFTLKLDETYVIKQNSNYEFIVYDSQNNELRRLQQVSHFYTDPILVEVLKSNKILITEKILEGKKIELFVYNLFKNQENQFKIGYFVDGNLYKEFDSMTKFLKSEYSNLIY